VRRFFIVLGDKTTAGGVVIQGEESCRNHGKALAYHGAQIYCHACKTTGYICNVPPYRPMILMGKQVALENDICICKCDPPPRLIASQNNASMSFDSGELAKMGCLPDGRRMPESDSATVGSAFDDRYQLLDANTGEPLAGVEYAIARANGQIEHGTTDADGHTHLLEATDRAEVVNIYA
jgi:uncharacterized Zn-binding protein involved in type VI secretion